MVKKFHQHGLDEFSSKKGQEINSPWEAEKQKSSKMIYIPNKNIIEKNKTRTLDKTIIEIMGSLFTSRLLHKYTQNNRDKMLFYSPETIYFEYGYRNSLKNENISYKKQENMRSMIRQLICPGVPLNKIKLERQRTHKIKNDDVNIGNWVSYAAGMLNQIFLQEGYIHGDPGLRHFFYIEPGKSVERVTKINTINNYVVHKGGIGVIDCESFRVTKPYSAEVKKDVEKFRDRLLNKFNQSVNEKFYLKGLHNAQEMFRGISIAKKVKEETMKKYISIFNLIKDFDFDARKITYK